MLVCTLPSPACMCSATNTRPCSTRWCMASTSASSGTNGPPAKMRFRSARSSCFHDTRIDRSCNRSNTRSAGSSASRRSAASATSSRPRRRRSSTASASGRSRFATYHDQRARQRCERFERLRDARAQHFRRVAAGRRRRRPSCRASARPRRYASTASSSCSLFASENSMLMRSIASVYSPSRSSGITTSSLILKAFVWRAMAAVFARSRQNVLRASAPAAVNPSPCRAFAIRTTSEVQRATASSSSPTMSPISTILGSVPRFDLVV